MRAAIALVAQRCLLRHGVTVEELEAKLDDQKVRYFQSFADTKGSGYDLVPLPVRIQGSRSHGRIWIGMLEIGPGITYHDIIETVGEDGRTAERSARINLRDQDLPETLLAAGWPGRPVTDFLSHPDLEETDFVITGIERMPSGRGISLEIADSRCSDGGSSS